MKLRGILIDPTARSITEVETEPYPVWKKLIDVDTIGSVGLMHNYKARGTETLWIDDEGLLNEKRNGPFFSVTMYPQPLAGKGLILRTDEEGESVSTMLTVEDVEKFVSWRPHIKFIGMKEIPAHKESHPIFGDVMVVGSTAQFEPKGDDK